MVKILVSWVVLTSALYAQTSAKPYEKRVAELEQRLQLLEQEVRELRAQKAAPAPFAPTVKPVEAPPATPPATPLPSTNIPSDETRLRVSGYMDFHFNKFRDQPAQLDFHRFVLLFGHSFSNRI